MKMNEDAVTTWERFLGNTSSEQYFVPIWIKSFTKASLIFFSNNLGLIRINGTFEIRYTDKVEFKYELVADV